MVMVIEEKVRILPDGRLRVPDAAIYLGVSEKTLAMWRCHGKGPKHLKKGRVFYFKDELDSWINDGKHE